MFNLDLTFLWTAVNLWLMYFFIKKFLFFRLARKMDERSASIAAGLNRGAELENETILFNKQREDWQKETAARQNEIMENSKAAAEREAAAIINDATREAARIKEDAKARAEQERINMRRQLSEETVRLALAAASGVLGENMDGERNRALAEKFIALEEAS